MQFEKGVESVFSLKLIKAEADSEKVKSEVCFCFQHLERPGAVFLRNSRARTASWNQLFQFQIS